MTDVLFVAVMQEAFSLSLITQPPDIISQEEQELYPAGVHTEAISFLVN